MKLNSISDYLADNDVGVAGKTLFVQDLPAGAGSPALMIKNSLDGTPIDYELPGYRKAKFQAIVRCKANKFVDGEALADLVSSVLTLSEKRIGDMNFKFIRPINEPVAYQLSDGANYEFSVNFLAVYVIVV